MCAAAVKYDWLTPAMRFRERGATLAFLCRRADEALSLSRRVG